MHHHNMTADVVDHNIAINRFYITVKSQYSCTNLNFLAQRDLLQED